MHLIPIILCGGEGARLWPVSREMHPKPFIRLDNGHSLLQKAFLHGTGLPGVMEILTVTNRELFFKIEDEFREINDSAVTTSFILEPFKRNTAAAIATAALQVMKTYGEESLILVLSADDLISDQDAFQQAVSAASVLALKDKLVAFGMKAQDASASYSFIEHEDGQILNFIEEPDLAQTHEYLNNDRYLWSSGIFLFKAGTILQAIEKQCPQILHTLRTCVEQSQFISGKNFNRLDLESSSFGDVPEKTIEEIIMADRSQAAVIPCDIHWTSISSWNALSELMPADINGNRIDGEAFLHDVENCHIQSDSRLIGAVGVNNLMIIDTHDALLVADKSRTHDIEHIYTKLKIQNHEAHKFHRTVHRPWGSYTILEESERFKIKRIEVKPGASLSLQMHHHRSEHWIVVSGMASVTNGEETFFVKTNESTYIPAGHKHRLENPGVLNLVMIEVQSGEYLGEDDIVRFQDNYGRV
ncbi:Alginate biosynthesis protein AlgA [Legionella massiliensis]|uniref:mannose-1-phosphate guanylyltransferase n=2 Tax=Legionella massiliensis TaxID=1034943 RepID=A0A078KP91_9GAMM|nr:Alginate biosynthesis protein AlgA [Legionella massiliensis]CEE11948.1 Alginate biosynthesis protein AlgA [Legionella massiliensis]